MKEMLWDETGSDTRTQPPWNMHNNEFEGMVTSQCLPRHGQSKYSCDVQWMYQFLRGAWGPATPTWATLLTSVRIQHHCLPCWTRPLGSIPHLTDDGWDEGYDYHDKVYGGHRTLLGHHLKYPLQNYPVFLPERVVRRLRSMTLKCKEVQMGD
ncbi:hypothetical protein Pmani_027934 [Petrolisthes manimaculis]|uniref:Uncharacterized protein n=1 Tax=Petrolisthes manimaculis TaxID=1843537 RepID=A0AAE1TVB1_9EUCA|nr:hypothetical protein Pmani_027934 [Petrolisthes manimaculis]